MARGLIKSLSRALALLTKSILAYRMTKEEIAAFNADQALDEDEIAFVMEPLADVLQESGDMVDSATLLKVAFACVFGARIIALLMQVKHLNEKDAREWEERRAAAKAAADAQQASVPQSSGPYADNRGAPKASQVTVTVDAK
jgi:hypothetical protein